MRTDYYVYCYENITNGKRYFGKGRATRINAHVVYAKSVDPRSLIAKAIKKHGIENFKVYKLYEGLTEDEAFAMERDCIARYGTNVYRHGSNAGYNQTDGGDGTAGCQCQRSEEYRRKLSQAHRNRSQRHRERLASAARRPDRLERLATMSRNKSPETRRKISLAKTNPSAELRAKLSDSVRKRMADADVKQRHCDAQRRRWEKKRLQAQLDVMSLCLGFVRGN